MLIQNINNTGKYVSQAVYKIRKKQVDLYQLVENIKQTLKRSKACSTQFFESNSGRVLQFFSNRVEPFVQIKKVVNIKELKEKSFKNYFDSNQQICVLLAKIQHEVFVCITFNHLILDGISVNLLVKDIENNMSGIKKIGYKKDPYLEFLTRTSNSKDYEYWKNKVSDLYEQNT